MQTVVYLTEGELIIFASVGHVGSSCLSVTTSNLCGSNLNDMPFDFNYMKHTSLTKDKFMQQQNISRTQTHKCTRIHALYHLSE